mmetsp:Transcript_31193/g.56579  ORF Transcript_31193/g.56579 Transcript_31193/m.56579 type:complete len:178 (-) Transcript_31193:89-622(-)
MSVLQNPENLLGAEIRVVTTFGEEIEGELFCVDIGGSNSVVLCQRLDNGHVNYKWTKTNIIREVTATSAPPAGAATEELPYVDLKTVEKRAAKHEEAAAKAAAQVGVGVSELAQETFNALAKTMEPEWGGDDILVLGVKISPPYDPTSSITGPNQQVVDRVKKVLVSEMSRKQKSGA